MPGKYGVIDTAYTPITYDEWMKPLVSMTQQHMAAEESINALDTQNALMAQYINPDDDPEAWARWSAYSEGLNRASDYLARNGISPQMRRDILDLNKQYNLKVKPIETAYNTRAAQIDAQEKAGPDELWERDARTISLDEYLANPKGPGIRHYNGADITKAVMDSMKNLREQILNDREHAGYWYSTLGGQYFERLVRRGYTDRDIVDIMTSNERGPAELRTILNNELAKTGVLDWAKPGSREYGRAVQYALAGLTGAVGRGDFSDLTDRSWEAAPSAPEGEDVFATGYDLEASPIYTPEERDSRAKTIMKIEPYFTYNGDNYVLNQTGIEALKDELNGYEKAEGRAGATMWGSVSAGQTVGQWPEPDLESYPLLNFIFSTNRDIADGGLDLTDTGSIAQNAGRLFGDFMNLHPDIFSDASRYWEYNYVPSRDDGNVGLNRLASALGDTKVQGVVFDKGLGRYKTGDKSMRYDLADVTGINRIRFGEHGVVMNVTVKDNSRDTKERSIDIMLPEDFHYTQYVELMKCIDDAKGWKSVVQSGVDPFTGAKLEEEDIADAEKQYVRSMQAAKMAIAYMFGSDRTKPNETETKYYFR